MADIAVTNTSATALGLYDKDGSYRVAGAMGGAVLVDPNMTSASVLDALPEAEVTNTPAKPANTVAPVISGDAEVGEVLTCSTGTWTGAPAPTFAFQWEADDEGWADLDGETDGTLELTEAHDGLEIRCTVTASNVKGDTSKTATAVGPVTGDD